MATYELITLVDITNSHASPGETNLITLGQQSNFNALCQTIGLRSNFSYEFDPIQDNGKLPRDLGGKATHWIWEFHTEREDTYRTKDNPVALLLEDLDGVPVMDLLNNSVDIDPGVFRTKGKNINTWVFEITRRDK